MRLAAIPASLDPGSSGAQLPLPPPSPEQSRDLRPQQPLNRLAWALLLNREATGADQVSRPVFTGSLDKPNLLFALFPPILRWGKRRGPSCAPPPPVPHRHPSVLRAPGAAPPSPKLSLPLWRQSLGRCIPSPTRPFEVLACWGWGDRKPLTQASDLAAFQ